MDGELRYWQQRYDEAAEAADEDFRTGRWVSRHYYAMVRETLARLISQHAARGARALDVCCGSGAMLETLWESGLKPLGIDISYGVLRKLKQSGQRNRFPVAMADASKLPVASGAVDFVLSVGMLQCLTELGHYFQGLRDVLGENEGRVLLLFSPNSWIVRRRRRRRLHIDPDMAHYRLHTLEDVCTALRNAGLEPIETRHLFYVFYAPLLRFLLRFLNRSPRLGRALTPLATSTVIVAERAPSKTS